MFSLLRIGSYIWTQFISELHLCPKDSCFFLPRKVTFRGCYISNLIDSTHTHKKRTSKRGLKTHKLLYSVLSVHFQDCCDDSLCSPIQWTEEPRYLLRKASGLQKYLHLVHTAPAPGIHWIQKKKQSYMGSCLKCQEQPGFNCSLWEWQIFLCFFAFPSINK